MNTDALIEMLARGAGAAPRAAVPRRLWPPALLGLVVSAAAASHLLGLAPSSLWLQGAWWLKFGYALALVAVGGWMTTRLARPVQTLAVPGVALVAVLAAMAALGAGQWFTAAPEERVADLLGSTWEQCSRNVLLAALAPTAAALWALRGLAPTRLRLAGAAAGLFGGALGALAYALSCPEIAFSFVAVWYSAGIALAAVVGALLGPIVLRW